VTPGACCGEDQYKVCASTATKSLVREEQHNNRKAAVNEVLGFLTI